MAGDVVKLPWIGLEIPRPKPWDLAAAAVLVLSLAGAGANLAIALGHEPGSSISGSLTATFVLGQIAIATLGLLVLGKTATLGTIWGNLLAVGALALGMSGVLLAAALWSAA
jgi:hypothetical protein